MSTHPLSFEETYKTSYSHGLESIYSLENVDLKTVRRMSESVAPVAKKEKTKNKISASLSPQLVLDWDGPWRTSIESFVPREPISVLALSKPCEKALLDNGKKQLKDLIDADLRSFIFFKGVGQGHIDEIRQKLDAYLDGKETGRCTQIDRVAWIRTVIAELDKKKAFVLLDRYGLAELITLSPSETVEVRRLTFEKKEEWIKEARQKIVCHQQQVEADCAEIAHALINPWLRQTGGYATEVQIMERLDDVSCGVSSQAVQFFNDLFFEGNFCFDSSLVKADSHLYCADTSFAEDYQAIVALAHSYFYRHDSRYLLNHLVTAMEKELAAIWKGFDEGLIVKVLRLSSDFRVRKGEGHQLMITLS